MAKQKTINILCEMLYQHDLTTFLSGGGERYALDFISLMRKMGYYVNVYQFSYDKRKVRYKNQKIQGLGNVVPGKTYTECVQNGTKEFNELSKNADGVFLLSMNLCQSKFSVPSLTCSHGLWWDCHGENPNLGKQMMQMMGRWVGNADCCISVDTNSIHNMQVINPIESKKMIYVPNYVDTKIFKPDNLRDVNKPFKVIIPRRIDPARGYIVSAHAALELSKKYRDIEFIFCGKGHMGDENRLHRLIDGHDNIKHVSAELEQMHRVYDDMTISWIPTVRAEGTSLSCLESLASGVPPIVTNIGGLTDLVSPMNNGMMIAPDSIEELVEATEYLYQNREEITRMRNLGLQMIEAFNKERWEDHIGYIATMVFGDPK